MILAKLSYFSMFVIQTHWYFQHINFFIKYICPKVYWRRLFLGGALCFSCGLHLILVSKCQCLMTQSSDKVADWTTSDRKGESFHLFMLYLRVQISFANDDKPLHKCVFKFTARNENPENNDQLMFHLSKVWKDDTSLGKFFRKEK